jgi:hypothetical protein
MSLINKIKERLEVLKVNHEAAKKQLEVSAEQTERMKAVVHAHVGAIEQVTAIIADHDALETAKTNEEAA